VDGERDPKEAGAGLRAIERRCGSASIAFIFFPKKEGGREAKKEPTWKKPPYKEKIGRHSCFLPSSCTGSLKGPSESLPAEKARFQFPRRSRLSLSLSPLVLLKESARDSERQTGRQRIHCSSRQSSLSYSSNGWFLPFLPLALPIDPESPADCVPRQQSVTAFCRSCKAERQRMAAGIKNREGSDQARRPPADGVSLLLVLACRRSLI